MLPRSFGGYNSSVVSDINCGVANDVETPFVTKAIFALWIWLIFLTFPGTYSMQPAVTTHTFGHK